MGGRGLENQGITRFVVIGQPNDLTLYYRFYQRFEIAAHNTKWLCDVNSCATRDDILLYIFMEIE